MQLKLKFQFKYETKGAVRYQELDKHGNMVEIQDGANVGPLYIRKSTLNGAGIPMELEVLIKGE